MSYEQTAGARYGIWGVDPYGPKIKQTALIPNIVNTGLKTAEGVGNLFAQRYKNQENEAKARLAQQTVDSEIAAKNAMNQANQYYYPLQQAAKLQQEQATIKEIMARTGVSYAQAKHIAAQTGLVNTQERNLRDPSSQAREMIKTWESLPTDSPQKIALGKMLDAQFAGSLFPSGRGKTGKTASTSGLTSTGAGNLQANPLQGGSRSGYHQAATTDANGNPVTVESPTMASASRAQMRKEAEAESKFLSPTILDGIKPYQGFGASIRYANDVLKAKTSPNSPQGQAAAKRIENFLTASRLLNETAAINARQATGQAPGIETLREFRESMFPALPGSFISSLAPSNLQAQASANYVPLQQGMAEQAINQERAGYEQQGAPAWASNNEPGFFGSRSVSNPEPQAQQQPQMDLNAMAEEAIARGANPEEVKKRLAQLQGSY